MQAVHPWRLPDRVLHPGRPCLVLGIVNVTPDSFSDGGQFFDPEVAVAHGLMLAEQGADLLDVGGESSRPGATPVSLDEELRRVVPVVRALVARTSVPISVDTYKADVADQALAAGALVVNDITGLRGDPEMPAVVRRHRAGAIVMHMRGTPQTMQNDPQYEDVVREVAEFFEERLQALGEAGIAKDQLVLDPGVGFGKTARHNMELLARLERFGRLERPVCLGVSRKGFLGRLLSRPLEERLAASLAAVCYAVGRGAAQVVRVHDVAATRDVLKLYAALDEVRLEADAAP